ncbi:MAG TPA: aspartate kinase [Candidatus Sulfotelmatobacter sp.]|jgi:aspartate kinase
MSSTERPSRFDRGDDVVVMKFGGTSVEDASAVRRLVDIVESRMGARPVVVVSALARVTDQLLEAGRAAAKGRLGTALAMVRDIYVRHETLADSLVDGSAYSALDRELRGDFQALEALLHDLDTVRELDRAQRDRLLGFGECFSSKLVNEALRQAGFNSTHVDARACIMTDANHGQANPLWDETNRGVQDALVPLLDAGRIPVLGGYIAATKAGVLTTLGRGGSDFTAAIVGAAISATRVEIWSDVDGVMTADPKLCPDARVIRKMNFDEAAELAQFGAKVLHPATLAPAMKENIPVYVLNSRRPDAEGTEITARARNSSPVIAITARRNVAVVEVESARGIDASFLDAVFAAFEKHSCLVDVFATSPNGVSLLAESDGSMMLEVAGDLRHAADVRWENHQALVCLIGENIRRKPEITSRVFGALTGMDARVLCHGASDRTISFLVSDSKAAESVQRLHALFFPKAEPLPDWGGISTAFCQAG